jgi:hypothetical protein
MPHDSSTHQLKPMTANAAQPTKAARPCAVMIAYHQPGWMRSMFAWLWRSAMPSRPAIRKIAVELRM